MPEPTEWRSSTTASSYVKIVDTYSYKRGRGKQRHRGWRCRVWRIDETGKRQEQWGPFAKKSRRAVEYAAQLARRLNREDDLSD